MPYSARVLFLLAAVMVVWPAGVSARRISMVDRVPAMGDRTKARLPAKVKKLAVQKYGLKAVALRKGFLKRHNTNYRYQVPLERKHHAIRNQQASGRCWAYATDKVMESKQVRAGKKPVELSKSFINYPSLRHTAITLLKKAAITRGRLPKLAATLSEGANQTRGMKIIEQYGAVPESKMPTTKDGASSGVFLGQIQRLVGKAAQEFARIPKGPQAKERTMSTLKRYVGKVDATLQTAVGKPPRKFKVDGKWYTPKKYAVDVLKGGADTSKYVVLTHDPTRAFNRRYKVTDGAGLTFQAYNVPMVAMQRAVKRTIRGGEAVYVSTNVSANNPHRADATKGVPEKARGILSLSAFDYNSFVPYAQLSKRQRIKAGVSPANHAMAITGYDPGPRGKVRKWKIDNSWGPKSGDKGQFHMYDDFFRHYVSKVQVPRSAVAPSVLKKLESRPLVEPKKKKKVARKG